MKRNFKYIKNIFAIVLFLCFTNCTKQVFEESLTSKTITVLAPINNLTTSSSSITFWWDKLEMENIKYRVQIVDSTFTNILQLVSDTSLTGNKFTISLSPGKYQWRIQAYNSGTETAFQTYNIKITSSPDISNQVLTLISPANGLVTKTASQIYKWDTLANADGYRFQVLNSSSVLVADYYLLTDSFPFTLSDGVYTWQVRGENTFSNSTYSSRTITIDLTAPTVPVPLTPTNAASIPNPVSISWSRDNSAIGDSVFISNDTLFTNPAISPFYTTSTVYSFTGISTKKYFWKIKSGDSAGNWSAWCATQKFTVQ
ncbi:MAG: hypothetical protein IAF38_03490 [Bacteroidia bacterium]|nr:hypothetical protein [Bacteroidia bacterium]